jgi:hypothetical protein
MKKSYLWFGFISVSLLLIAAVQSIQSSRSESSSSQTDISSQPIEVQGTATMLTKSVRAFGATPNDTLDDTAAIQRTINAVAKSGGGRVYFPGGTYLVSINSLKRSSSAIKIRSNIKLQGAGAAKSVIKLADQQGNYDSIFGAENPSSPVSNFAMYDLAVDGNGLNNPTNGSQDLQETGLFRHAIRIYAGENIRIARNRFFDQVSVNTISVNGNSIKDVKITTNTFDLIGGGDVDYDHSTIYSQGKQITISNNTFSSRFGSGTRGARTAIEIHGDDQVVTKNKITGYLYGVNVTGTGWPNGSENQLYANNVLQDVGTGFVLWSNRTGVERLSSLFSSKPGLANVTIRNNQISIDVNGWRNFFAQEPRSGITFEPNRNAPIRNLDIANNNISFSNSTGVDSQSDYFASGITLWKHSNPNVSVQDIQIRNNRIQNTPGPGIFFDSPVQRAQIVNNQIINPGRSQNSLDDIYRSAIYLANRVSGIQINDNTLVDNQSQSTMKFGVVNQANCSGGCSNRRNSLQVLSGAPVPLSRSNSGLFGM